jgi:hypothetical protein
MSTANVLQIRTALARLASLAAIATAFTLGYLVFSAAPVQAEACPNEAFRTGFSAHLPDCRAYEMVSPAYKEGYGVEQLEAVSPNGETAVFGSPGTFSGAPSGLTLNLNTKAYISRRGPSGWSTASLRPPASLTSEVVDSAQELSPSLESTVLLAALGPNFEASDQEATQEELLFHDTSAPDVAANWAVGGPVLETLQKKHFELKYAGGSADLCHFVGRLGNDGEEPLLPGVSGTSEQRIYEVDRGCNGEPPALRFVGLNNSGTLISPGCQEALGFEAEGFALDSLTTSAFNAVPANGHEIFFTANVESGCAGDAYQEGVYQVFVRVGGSRTLEVSRPLQSACGEVPCGGYAVASSRASASFVGASRDGSRVFFTTRAPLVEADRDQGNDLYMAKIGCPSGEGEACEPAETQNTKVTSLVQASHDSHAGEAAEVQGVVGLAPDGSRVYFVARGVLGEGPGAQGKTPVAGADNLYVYDTQAGRISFIADLCSGSGASGVTEDANCPTNLTTGEGSPVGNDSLLWDRAFVGYYSFAETAGTDGGFLVFPSYGQLVSGDTDNARDVYRYDAHTSTLERVSIGEEGFEANGNCDDSGALGGEAEPCDAAIPTGFRWGGKVQEQYALNSRAISEDGSRIVFTTAASLSSNATNGVADVYEWRADGTGDCVSPEGCVALISGGSATQPVVEVSISPEGNDVFFVTSQGLLPQDADGAPDLYDARVDGGFPPAPTPVQECSGDACQGPLTDPAPLLVPGSVSQAPGENLPALAPAVVKPKQEAKPRRCAKGKKLSHGKCTRSKKAKKAKKAGNDRRPSR